MSAVSQPGDGRSASSCPVRSPGAAADRWADMLAEDRVSVMDAKRDLDTTLRAMPHSFPPKLLRVT